MSEGLWREWYDPLRKQDVQEAIEARNRALAKLAESFRRHHPAGLPAFLQPIPIEWTDFDRALARRLGILLD